MPELQDIDKTVDCAIAKILNCLDNRGDVKTMVLKELNGIRRYVKKLDSGDKEKEAPSAELR